MIQIGMREEWGQQVPFGGSLLDLRQHTYVIGKTGSGKTTLLRNMIIQHIALGHGVGLIDPHGDLAEELLNHIPAGAPTTWIVGVAWTGSAGVLAGALVSRNTRRQGCRRSQRFV